MTCPHCGGTNTVTAFSLVRCHDVLCNLKRIAALEAERDQLVATGIVAGYCPHCAENAALRAEVAELKAKPLCLCGSGYDAESELAMARAAEQDARAEVERLLSVMNEVASDLESGIESRRGAYLRLLAEAHAPRRAALQPPAPVELSKRCDQGYCDAGCTLPELHTGNCSPPAQGEAAVCKARVWDNGDCIDCGEPEPCPKHAPADGEAAAQRIARMRASGHKPPTADEAQSTLDATLQAMEWDADKPADGGAR
jgi:hypothetical protein